MIFPAHWFFRSRSRTATLAAFPSTPRLPSSRCSPSRACQGSLMFAIKGEVSDPSAETFAFNAQKTMYDGKYIAKGDTIFIFASENEGGPGLIASGVVTSAKAIAKKRGIARQTPRVSISIRRTALAKRRLGQ